MLVLSSQSRLLGSNPVDQEPVRTFQKGPPPEKAKLRRWWTYLSQLRLTVHHIEGVKNECADYISRNNFDALIGARSEALAKEAFSRMDVHLDLNMTMIRPLDGLQQSEYLKEFGDIYKRLEKCLEPLLVNQDQWKRDKSSLWHEDRIMVPSDRVPALLKWTHESSGHVGADRTLRLFKQWFHTTWTDDQLRKTLQPIVDKCPCSSCKPGDIMDRGLYSTLPIPHCANSVLYVDYTEMPKFGGYDFALVVTCGLTRFTRVFPCTKHITGEETIKILLEEWFCVYGAPKEINSDKDVRVRSDTGWYKRVLRSLNVQVSTGIPYSHTSNPLCERHIRVLKENVRIWCKTERTRDWVRLPPVISLMMNSQEPPLPLSAAPSKRPSPPPKTTHPAPQGATTVPHQGRQMARPQTHPRPRRTHLLSVRPHHPGGLGTLQEMPPPYSQGHASGLVPGGNPKTTRRIARPQPRTPGHRTPLPGSPGQRSHHERGGDTGPAPTPHQTHGKPHGGSSAPPARGSPQSSGPNGTPQTPPVNTRRATHRPHCQRTHAASHPLPCRA